MCNPLYGNEVYVASKTDRGPEKTFPIGTFDFDQTNRRWKITMTSNSESPSSASLPHIANLVDERLGIEDPSMATRDTQGNIHSIDYINNHTDERQAVVGEVVDEPSHATDAHISEQESHLKPPDFCNWVILDSGFNNKTDYNIWVHVKCPEPELFTKSVSFQVGGNLFEKLKITRFTGGGFLLTLAILHLNIDVDALLRKDDQDVDLVSRHPYGRIYARFTLGKLSWLDSLGQWIWKRSG